jgi:hypothetical protein
MLYICIYIYTYHSQCFSVSLSQNITIIQKVGGFGKFVIVAILCMEPGAIQEHTLEVVRLRKNPLAGWVAQTSAVARIWSSRLENIYGLREPRNIDVTCV